MSTRTRTTTTTDDDNDDDDDNDNTTLNRATNVTHSDPAAIAAPLDSPVPPSGSSDVGADSNDVATTATSPHSMLAVAAPESSTNTSGGGGAPRTVHRGMY
jgi:hypothetical protein